MLSSELMMILGNCPLQKLMMFTVPDAVTDDVYLKNLKINFWLLYLFFQIIIIIRYVIMEMPVDNLILPVKHFITFKNLQVENLAKF
jgi:hypothetical protein